MNRFLLALTLLVASTGASAFFCESEDTPPEQLDACRGFVIGGLASQQVAGVDRTDLWLAYNYLMRADTVGKSAGSPEFRSGYQRFADAPDGDAVQQLLNDSERDCGRGRSERQITGW